MVIFYLVLCLCFLFIVTFFFQRSDVFVYEKYSSVTNIPRIIHQTWKTNQLPRSLVQIIEHNRQLHPQYEYRFYTDEDIEKFLKTHFHPRVWNAYARINPHYGPCRSDFFRYFCIYVYGGVYMDIKIKMLKSLDGLLTNKDDYILSFWKEKYNWELFPPHGEYQNWHLIFAPKHELLERICQTLVEKIEHLPIGYGRGKWDVLNISGPLFYTRQIKKWKSIVETIDISHYLYYPHDHFMKPEWTRDLYQTKSVHYSQLREPIIMGTRPDYIPYSLERFYSLEKCRKGGVFLTSNIVPLFPLEDMEHLFGYAHIVCFHSERANLFACMPNARLLREVVSVWEKSKSKESVYFLPLSKYIVKTMKYIPPYLWWDEKAYFEVK